jgi:1-acyl-sn-glycerol-3-phosphate acyltransferase
MAKAELMGVPVLGRVIQAVGAFPVKRGEADLSAIKTAMSVLKAGGRLVMFPEGTRVLGDEAAAAKTGVSMLAFRTGAPVVPVFLRTAPLRPFRRTLVRFGTPLYAQTDGGKPGAEQYHRFADEVMAKVRKMRTP